MLANTTYTDSPAPDDVRGRGPETDHRTTHPEAKRSPATPKTGLPHLFKPPPSDRATWETGDDYDGVFFLIPGTAYRVAACPKGYCWLLQQRRGRHRWENRKYFATKRRLAAVLPSVVGTLAAEAVREKVDALPI